MGVGLTTTRTFDAPRELVWTAWTDPELFMRWWGPKAFTSPVARIDLRVGGHFLFAMRSPEGRDFWNTGVFREIVAPERFVSSMSFSDGEGTVVAAEDYGMPGDWPIETVLAVTLEEQGGRTTVAVRQAGIPKEASEMAQAGWLESFDKLELVLEEMGSRGGRPC